MRRHLDGQAHYLSCGCRDCVNDMQREFARILDASYEMDELLDVVQLSSEAHRIANSFNSSADALVARINAYSAEGA